MKRWIETRLIDPPSGVVLSALFGNSGLFVSYSPLLDQWYHVYPGGEEKIAEPEMILVDEDWIRNHRLVKPRPKREVPRRIRRRKAEQLRLF